MSDVTLIMDPDWEAKINRQIQPTIERVTKAVGTDVKQNLLPHNKTGELLESVDVDARNGIVSVGTDHWHFIEFGTSPHIEKAPPGHELFAGFMPLGTIVHHPGTREYAPMRRALYKPRNLR